MILYSNSALAFRNDVDFNQIEDKIEKAFKDKMGYVPAIAERISWRNSMQYMERIVRNAGVPNDCGILIEFNIPSTSKRIDFMITGQDQNDRDNFIIIELKQWEQADFNEKPGVVTTFVGGHHRDVTHPSYQAWSYHAFLKDMNEAVYSGSFTGHACAYLHNYRQKSPEPLLAESYQAYIADAPIFFKDDFGGLQEYIHRHVCRGRGINTLFLIENGKIRPSKKLMDHVAGLFAGNQEFVLLDEQKIVFESILEAAGNPRNKTVIMVVGGPGTGKSVISMNAFGQLLQRKKNIQFVAPNAAFRSVMVEMLAQNKIQSKMRLEALFQGSSCFYDTPENYYDILVVDEAHRLKDDRAYMYKGKNQVEDVIRAAFVTVLFVDDHQQIRPEDIGSTDEIRRVAQQYGAEILELKLSAQFRCAGAEGFLNWMNDVLQIEHTANFDGWDTQHFDFKIFDSPVDVQQAVREKVQDGFKARLLAGYAWHWTSEKDGNPSGEIEDVVIEEHGFSMPWNKRSSRELWAVQPDGLDYVGCIHTTQGLEFDYVGVLIGNDLQFDEANHQVQANVKEYKDKSGKKGIAKDSEKVTQLVKNIYRVLCSRGMRGCYIYCRNLELSQYIQKRLNQINPNEPVYYEIDEQWDQAGLRVAEDIKGSE
jgi:hypothetical protein